MPSQPTPSDTTAGDLPLDLQLGTLVDLADACPIGEYVADFLSGQVIEVGDTVACPDCGHEHQVVAAVPVFLATNLRIIS
ncbi:MAG: hypothetical protein ABS81_08155 [Pseudonocardia sp. SCN 72-86]|nr:MAG: hypothetical protein ABS81_08155 [Pseudonocardia sp. SCN 72-86]